MSQPAPQPDATPDAQPDAAPDVVPVEQAAEDALYYRQALHQLIDMGLDLARQLHQRATAEPPPESASEPTPDATPDPTIAFDRIARAVRRTVALARSLAEPPPAAPGAQSSTTHRLLARKRLIREVEDAIQRSTDDHDAELLHAELYERLDSPELEDDIAARPVSEIIADICRDLGIAAPPNLAPWKRRTPADIIHLCARAATPPPANPPRADPLPARLTRLPPVALYPLRL